MCIDEDRDGYGRGCVMGPDCDDGEEDIHPGATERCNRINDDCDNTVDEGCDCTAGETQPCEGGVQRCVDGQFGACTPLSGTVALGNTHTCAVFDDGVLRCWGRGDALGQGTSENWGDNSGETGLPPAVDLGSGQQAHAVVAGLSHTCAVLSSGALKCWGLNASGQLGLGDDRSRGEAPGEMGDALSVVDLGTDRTVRHLAAGSYHNCAILDDDQLKCWGSNDEQQLGVGDLRTYGDDLGEMGDDLPAVDLGPRRATSLALGHQHTCALLDDGSVYCWGDNVSGQLGLGHRTDVSNTPPMGAAVDLGTGRTAIGLSAGNHHTCALLDDNTVRCWGLNSWGQLGGRDSDPSITGDDIPTVNLGTDRHAVVLAGGDEHHCALLDNASLRCWGANFQGQLGLGDTEDRGRRPAEMGDALPTVELDGAVEAIHLGPGDFTCATLRDRTLKCWGHNFEGQLGLGDRDHRGDEPGELGSALEGIQL